MSSGSVVRDERPGAGDGGGGEQRPIAQGHVALPLVVALDVQQQVALGRVGRPEQVGEELERREGRVERPVPEPLGAVEQARRAPGSLLVERPEPRVGELDALDRHRR
jgi:hypothetical protein